MNNDRIITLENRSDYILGLKDTQGRTYILHRGGKQRISAVSLQDILDYPASKNIFLEGDAIVDNVSADELFRMGLTEEEIRRIAPNATIEELEEEIIEEVPVVEESEETEEATEEEVEEKVVEEVKEEKVVKTAPAKKPAAKKSSSKKTTRK
jgi:hypothetical protein